MDRRVPLGASSTYRPTATSRPAARQSRQPAASSSQISGAHAASPPETQEGESSKKKRCRVTREQLEQLEILFAANMSPTIERRKEIAIALGMTDRQTQIWFQNRYEVFLPGVTAWILIFVHFCRLQPCQAEGRRRQDPQKEEEERPNGGR